MLLKIGLVLYRCFSRVLMSLFCVVVHMLQNCYLAFLGQGLAFFGEDRLATLLCSLARFDLANRGVRQPVQPHTYA